MDPALLFAFLEEAQKGNLSEDDKEAIDVAAQCLCRVNGVAQSDASKHKLPVGLSEIFAAGCQQLCPEALGSSAGQEAFEQSETFKKFLKTVEDKGVFKNLEPGSDAYKARYKKVVEKYKSRFGASTGKSDIEQADEMKAQGNKLLQAGDLQGSFEAYTKAIELSPSGANTHIYYCNRAAVLLRQDKPEDAAKDCSASIVLKPEYHKAHSRLAQAYLRSGNNMEAAASAKRTLELDPGNKVASEVLQSAGGDRAVAPGSVPAAAPGAAAAGMPGMAGIMGEMMQNPELMQQMNEMKQSMAAGGGMPDMASLMSNPNFMNMAQGMMQNPAIAQMANSMSQNPEMMAQMMQSMGGAGGLGGLMGAMGGAPPKDDSADKN